MKSGVLKPLKRLLFPVPKEDSKDHSITNDYDENPNTENRRTTTQTTPSFSSNNKNTTNEISWNNLTALEIAQQIAIQTNSKASTTAAASSKQSSSTSSWSYVKGKTIAQRRNSPILSIDTKFLASETPDIPVFLISSTKTTTGDESPFIASSGNTTTAITTKSNSSESTNFPYLRRGSGMVSFDIDDILDTCTNVGTKRSRSHSFSEPNDNPCTNPTSPSPPAAAAPITTTPHKPFEKKTFSEYMTSWLRDNWTNPYPDDDGLESMARDCGTTTNFVSNWLINARTRKWRPAIVKAYEYKRPACMLMQDSIDIFDGKELKPLDNEVSG